MKPTMRHTDLPLPPSRLPVAGVVALAAACLASAVAPASAEAESVVVLHAHGDLPVEQVTRLEEQLVEAIREVGHEPFTERGALAADAGTRPETANELRAVAEIQGATYVVDPTFDPAPGDRVRIGLRVGYAPETRVEELVVDAPLEAPRGVMVDAVGRLLRPGGAGPAAAAEILAAQAERDRAAREAEAAAREEAEAARRAAEREEDARRAAEAAARADAAREAPYGAGGDWMISAGLAVRPILAGPDRALGGTLGSAEVIGGLLIDDVPGLELRGGLEVVFGAANGFALTGGAAYFFQPFDDVPFFLGPGAELGWFQGTSGDRGAALLLRAKPVLSYRFDDDLFVEASLPEIQWISTDGGSTILGFAARLGTRF
jgi:hypothetical protein